MKTIGIIGAMPSELVDIRAALGEGTVQTNATFQFHINEIHGKKIISVCSGIGKVNAALCAQNLIHCYGVEAIINAGIAGGMDTAVKVCDVVVSKDVMHHDLMTRFLENYPPHNGTFKADERLVKIAEQACAKNGINCFNERIVSGEVFVSDSAVKKAIKDEFNPYAVDMESAAVGHCAFMNGTPFVTVRCISDNADEQGEMSFDEFEKVAAGIVAKVTFDILEHI